MTTCTTPPSLSSKQKRFLEIYHQTGKAGASWSHAGYTASEKTARSAASRFLKRDDAQAYLHDLQRNDNERTSLNREKLFNRLEQIIDSPDARDRDVIQAIREANRMLGTYNKPEPPPRKEPEENHLREYIAAVRRGETPDSHPEILNHLFEKESASPPEEPERSTSSQQDNSYQPTEAERLAIIHHTVPRPKSSLPTMIHHSGDPWADREEEQNAKIAANKGCPQTPPSKAKPIPHKTTPPPASTYQTRLKRLRWAQRRKAAAGQ
ncbi:MAG: hypothetical protein CMO55_27215 [Verrucomicrobiales bacterium]|nr:hypothetical protein [Verrucomicrobiales bacterium]